MAAYGATIGASFAIGPAVGGALTTWLGWRAVFFINIPLGLIARRGGSARSVRWDPIACPDADAPAAPVPPPRLHRRAAGGVRDLSLVLRALPVHDPVLQDVLHLSVLDAGLVYLPGTLLLFVVSGASAKLSEHIAPAALVTGGLVLVAARDAGFTRFQLHDFDDPANLYHEVRP